MQWKKIRADWTLLHVKSGDPHVELWIHSWAMIHTQLDAQSVRDAHMDKRAYFYVCLRASVCVLVVKSTGPIFLLLCTCKCKCAEYVPMNVQLPNIFSSGVLHAIFYTQTQRFHLCSLHLHAFYWSWRDSSWNLISMPKNTIKSHKIPRFSRVLISLHGRPFLGCFQYYNFIRTLGGEQTLSGDHGAKTVAPLAEIG